MIKDISNKSISKYFILINVIGISLSILQGIYGGSGGGTTEGVFLGLFYTNIISILFGLIILIIKKSWWSKNFIWGLLILLIYYPVTSTVVENIINNSKDKIDQLENVGSVNNERYIDDKSKVKSLLDSQGSTNYTLDTLIYSKQLTQFIAFCSYKYGDKYKNFEVFGLYNKTIKLNHPKGGSIMAEDTSKSTLNKRVLNYYFTTFSTNKNNKFYIWTYIDFW